MRLGTAAVLLLVPAAALAQTGDVFSSRDGKFSARFPGAPKEEKQAVKSPIGELAVVSTTYVTAEGNVYMVSYTDFPEGAAKAETRDALYDGAAEGLAGKDGKAVSNAAVEVGADKLPGRDLVIDKGGKRIRMRVVLRGSRLYQVGGVGTTAFADGKTLAGFIESFTPGK